MLNDRCLYYFQHTAENVPKGIIPLENIRVRAVDDRDGKQFVFEIYSEMAEIIKGCKTDSNGTVVQGNHKYYRLVPSPHHTSSHHTRLSSVRSVCLVGGEGWPWLVMIFCGQGITNVGLL